MHSPSRQPRASLPWLSSIRSRKTRGSASREFMRMSVPSSQSISPRGSVASAAETAEAASSQSAPPQ